MSFSEKLDHPGEHHFEFRGVAGSLEGFITIPTQIKHPFVAFLGHPHSLQGGTMNNKVVTTMARAFKELGIPSLRFNFRGVGQSQGSYDDGVGESEDMLLLLQDWQREKPAARVFFAGFSFGSYVAYRAAAQVKSELLITIAPPVHHYDYRQFAPAPSPWLILQGEDDDVVPPSYVFDFAKDSTPALPVIPFSNTGHFFHGKLLELKAHLIKAIGARMSEL
jgi:alpha/beta superfamily hydrolase